MSTPETLLELQRIDLRLLKCASSLKAMPQSKRLQTIDAAAKKVASELTGIVGQRKDLEMEVGDTESALAHFHDKTAEVQAAAEEGTHTHRELRDIEQQLTSLAKHVEKAEFTLGPLRERLGRLRLAEKNAQLTASRLADERAATQESLDRDSAEVRAEIMDLSHRRERAVAELPADLVERYEAARRRFKGLAVERLHGNVPSTCRVTLQPSQFHDLSRGPEIAECPYCHRILITSEEEQS